MIKDVRVNPHFQRYGIVENHRAYPTDKEIRIFGGDTETVNGDPWTLQLSNGDESMIKKITPKTIFPEMMNWLKPRAREHGVNLVFFHNLNFDLRVLFHENLRDIYDQYNDIRLKKDGWKIKILFGKVNCADLTKDGLKIRLLDSMAFCPPGSRSLKVALKIFGVDGNKLKQPKGLGEKKLWGQDFRTYALNDAIVEQKLGVEILALHREYDLTPCISLPMLASRVLRHHFFNDGETFPLPPPECRTAAELSYHAGKNGFYVPRGIYERAYEYDINSAFPYAMRLLPQFVRGRYAHTREYQKGRVGLYEVSGQVEKTRFPSAWDHSFTALKNTFAPTWVTGFEIELMREDPAYQFKIHQGWIWEPDERHKHNPLQEFVDRFWHLKNTTPKGPKRDTYKNILNSLYGKFAGCVEIRKVHIDADGNKWPLTQDKFFRAGSMYHPFIASQITGHVRAILTRLERQGNAMHSATDSIKTLKKLKTSNDLGGLKEEVYGRCYLFRTKLYLHFAIDNSRCGHDLNKVRIWDTRKGEPRQHLCKFALHGFKGSAEELFKNRYRLLKEGSLSYSYRHMTGLREGIRRNEKICAMNDRRETLCL